MDKLTLTWLAHLYACPKRTCFNARPRISPMQQQQAPKYLNVCSIQTNHLSAS